ncbi:MAG: hypothetical protein HEQ22_00870 [Sphingopyxis sp.]
MVQGEGPPEIVAIDHDDYTAKYIGRMRDGRQFFLTTPFVPASPEGQGCEFVALYFFDAEGQFLNALIDSFGPRDTMDDDARKQVYDDRLSSLGEVSFERIEIEPFSVEKFGVLFGLIPCEPHDEDGIWTVEAQPGNYMAFYEPWDSGDYDT